MKRAILLLVLANVVFFFWMQHHDGTTRKYEPLPPPDIGRLALTSEAPSSLDADRRRELQRSSAADYEQADSSLAPDTESVLAAAPPEAEQEPVVSTTQLNDRIEEDPDSVTDAVMDMAGETTAIEAAPTAATDFETTLPIAGVAGEAAEPETTSSEKAEENGSAVLLAPGQPESAMQTESTEASQQMRDQAAAWESRPDNEAAAGAKDPESEPQTEETAVEPVCARVGPFTGEDADELISRLPPFIRLYSDVSEELVVIERFYAMIPPLPSRAIGRQRVQELADAGFTDTWLFPRGEYRNAISLGLFRYEPRAARHAAQVRAAGFEAVVEPQRSRREVRWLSLQNIDGGDLAPSLPLPDSVQVSPQACP